ncbi:hypothetical protein BG011_008166 [Mortierella polycephala]|uniref:Survival Motor Neuron Gemin2-binding domain-containing protein n=1 Tax=Mortierella polycephala TaxID=41804 RepID=A0A9P6QD99_9FUNG|nr:hypothetical protein BG011_008166 [Mortierella polycephala]
MTEEERPQLEHTHGEYRDEEDAEGDYNEYDENEEEYYEGEDGGEDEEGANAQVGEEIALTHEEVWDDSALIEAWDAAVKQYEVGALISKKQSDETIVSTPLTKTKNKAVEPESPALPSKRAKLSNDPSNVVTNGQSNGTGTIESEAAPTDQQSTPSLKPEIPPNTPVYAVSERKPSFKKADKPSFSHHKVPQQKKATKTGVNGKIGASTSKPIKTTVPSAPPPVDAATIAYYQRLGYCYDPTYLGANAAEAGNEEQEHEVEEDETATRIRASTSANPLQSIYGMLSMIKENGAPDE